MSAQHAIATRAEATSVSPHENRVSDIQPFEVPAHWPPVHWPPTDWAQERWMPEAYAGQGDEQAAAGARPCGPAGDGHAWPRQFAVLLAEALAGVRPARQLLPWLSERGSLQLHRLLPLFADGHRPHVTRVLTAEPARDVIEMTLVVTVGRRTRALAVRLERIDPGQRPAWRDKLAAQAARPQPQSAASPRWLCTAIEAA